MEEVSEEARWGPGARNQYIIHYVLKGRGYFNGVLVEREQGFLIRANELVQYYGDTNDPWQYFWVIFTGTASEEVCREHLCTDENGIFCYGFSAELNEFIENSFSEKSISQAKALSIFYHILSLCEKKMPSVSNHYVADAKDYINICLHRPFSVSDIALELGISDRYLYNLFMKYEGKSPKQYINEVKLRNAEMLLKNSHCTVAEVAVSVGFYDPLAFSRFFSKKKGVSPSEYRKRHSS